MSTEELAFGPELPSAMTEALYSDLLAAGLKTTAEPFVAGNVREVMATIQRLVDEETVVLLCATGERERVEAIVDRVRTAGPCRPVEVRNCSWLPPGEVWSTSKLWLNTMEGP